MTDLVDRVNLSTIRRVMGPRQKNLEEGFIVLVDKVNRHNIFQKLLIYLKGLEPHYFSLFVCALSVVHKT